MNTHISKITTKAITIWCSPKKIIDQDAFSTSCTKNTAIAAPALGLVDFLFQTRNSEIPITVYKMIQTGANIQPGGFNAGLFKAAYQVGIDSTVKNEPMIPASWQIRIQKINFRTFFIYKAGFILLIDIFRYSLLNQIYLPPVVNFILKNMKPYKIIIGGFTIPERHFFIKPIIIR